jgi:hypothetical protein
MVGNLVGEKEGGLDGFLVGGAIGRLVRLMVGNLVGRAEGRFDGLLVFVVGSLEGRRDGFADGFLVGFRLGRDDGFRDGRAVGLKEGFGVGPSDGLLVGFAVGLAVGRDEGFAVGLGEGFAVGRADGLNVNCGNPGGLVVFLGFTFGLWRSSVTDVKKASFRALRSYRVEEAFTKAVSISIAVNSGMSTNACLWYMMNLMCLPMMRAEYLEWNSSPIAKQE